MLQPCWSPEALLPTANLRETFERRAGEVGLPVYFPSRPLSTDNAAMIAAAAYPRFLAGDFAAADLNCGSQTFAFARHSAADGRCSTDRWLRRRAKVAKPPRGARIPLRSWFRGCCRLKSPDGKASGSPSARIAMYCAVHLPIPGISHKLSMTIVRQFIKLSKRISPSADRFGQ